MINALTSLRFYVMITIFLSHLTFLCGSPMGSYIYYTFFDGGSAGVAFFFVLSGFVINLGYGEKFEVITKKNYFDFVKKRIKKIYPLYVLMMGIMFIDVIKNTSDSMGKVAVFGKFLVSLSMTQTMVPYQPFAQMFNGAAWFLSCITILYLLTPFILKWNKKIRNKIKQTVCTMIILFLIFETLAVFFSANLTNGFKYGLLYCSPYIRVFFYVYGVLLGNVFCGYCDRIKQWGRKNVLQSTGLEIGSILMFLFGYIVITNYDVEISYLVNMILSGVLILVFACSLGKVSDYLNRKTNVALGGISFEFYLIHYPLIVLGWRYIVKLGLSGYGMLIWSLIFFVITIGLAFLARSVIKHLYSK